MRKYARLLASYAAIAITGMVLYTPWLVGLTPSDPSILRAGLSVISGILLTGAFGASTYAYLKEPEYRLLESSEVNEPDDVLPQLRQFTELPAVGGFAAEAVSQIESMDRRHRRLNQVIDSTFGPESLSHDKFTAVVDAAERTLLKNCALLSNRIQAFDVDGYRANQRRLPNPVLQRLFKNRKQNRPELKPADSEDLGEERQRVYNDALDDMRQVIDANERLLLEMGKLEMELSDLESDDNREDNTQMLEEVQGLLEQTKYYR